MHALHDTTLVYLINPGGRTTNGVLELEVGNKKARSVRDIVGDEPKTFTQKGGTISIPLSVEGSTATVILIEP